MSFAAIFVGPHFVSGRWQCILLQLRLKIVNLEYLTIYIVSLISSVVTHSYCSV